MPFHTKKEAKRRIFGQHFLRDESIAQEIADTAIERATATQSAALLEIGPGRGAITDPIFKILPENLKFIIVEKDHDLADDWKTQASGRADVHEADFLEIPDSKWLGRKPLTVVSNLPYSTGTAILQKLARQVDSIPAMVLMFQAEVAQRLRAEPRTKAWGSLSIWIQNRWDVTRLCSVRPGAFMPPPKVHSEVIILQRRESPRVPVRNEKVWDSLLKTAFAHRRKMLRSGLPPEWRTFLEPAGIDGTKRAEELTWEDWARFYEVVERSRQTS